MISQGQCTIFKQNLLNGLENFTSGIYRLALYTALANLDASTTAYTTSGEVSGAGYTAGGKTLTNIVPASGDGAAYVSFQNISWAGSGFTTRAALIYNGTTGAAVSTVASAYLHRTPLASRRRVHARRATRPKPPDSGWRRPHPGVPCGRRLRSGPRRCQLSRSP